MQLGPGLAGGFPRLDKSLGRVQLGLLAVLVALYPLLDLLVEPWPPDVVPGESFHPHDPWVSSCKACITFLHSGEAMTLLPHSRQLL